METKAKDEELINDDDFDSVDDDENSASDGGDESSDEKSNHTNSDKSQEELEKEKEKAKNARFAEMRRKKEAEEKAKKDAEESEKERKIRADATLKAELGLMKTNTFTNEPIRDEEDLKIYKIQLELEEEGKDPVSDLPSKLAQINRKAVAEAKKREDERLESERAIQAKIDSEIKELREKYPKLDTGELAKDPLYAECLSGRAGRWTQLEIYELYLSEKEKAQKKEEDEKEKSAIADGSKKISKMPSSSANGKVTPNDIANMTDEEFKAYWNKKYGN